MQIVRQNFETSFVVKKDVSHALIHALRPTIPILIVFDGEIETHPGSGFSLSKLIDLLERPPSLLALRGRFGVVLAERGHGQPQTNPNPQRYEPKYSRFRFNMQGFDLTRFHEVWLFGWASEGDLDLAPEELSILASWMNAGGGVFATGDHDTHGASLSGSILRLRSMRRWRHDQNPPPGSGRQRRETTQPAIAGQGVTGEGGADPGSQRARCISQTYHSHFPQLDYWARQRGNSSRYGSSAALPYRRSNHCAAGPPS